MRSLWSGTISFGLINIPVKLASAVQSEEIDFDLLSKDDLAPIRYARIDTQTGKEVDWKHIVKGYQYAKGKYVVVEDEDFEKASPAKSKSIDILQFAKEEEIDPIYYEKPYYILPGKGAEKGYQLLLQALKEAQSVGLAEFMLRNREHICVVRAHGDVLILHQMYYHQEIKEAPAVPQPKQEKVTAKEVELAVKLIQQLSEKFNPAAFKDTYIEALKKVIKAKAAGKQIRIAEPEEKPVTVKDLMEVLKQSLDKTKKRA
ncbi:MAG: Ku protein [Flavisolibacter sp.]|nr:Ku protein [Flavisolibacter sp.]